MFRGMRKCHAASSHEVKLRERKVSSRLRNIVTSLLTFPKRIWNRNFMFIVEEKRNFVFCLEKRFNFIRKESEHELLQEQKDTQVTTQQIFLGKAQMQKLITFAQEKRRKL